LDTNVIDVLFLDGCCGLDFNETPPTVFATMEHINAHENTAVFERTFEDRRNFPVRD